MSSSTTSPLLPNLQVTVDTLRMEFDQIPEGRRAIIRQLIDFVNGKVKASERVLLNFICTHNSRRSHISQIWAQAAAHYYAIPNVETFSGGTEATAFNPRAVTAMKRAGFDIAIIKAGSNPVYKIKFAEDARALTVFSKTFDDDFNPKKDFAAIMTCSHADENCPVISGAAVRIALTYNDPKDYDGTTEEAVKYTERVNQIGREILYAFSQMAIN